MGYLRSLPKISAISLLVTQAFLTMPAFAAGFALDGVISPSLEGNANAGAAAAKNDVSAMFFNPATLATLQQNQAYLGGNEVLPSVKMTDASATHTVVTPGIPPSSSTAVVLGQDSQNNVSRGTFIPDAYISWRFNNKLVGGLGLIAPYGLITDYYHDSVVRFMAQYSAVKSIDINPALAYSINDKWAVGVGFQAQYIRATFSNFNGPYTGVPSLDALIAANHPTYLKADGWGYGYTVGVLYSPDLCTRLGLSYRSQISEQLEGDGQQYTGPGGTVPAPSSDFLFNAETSVNGSTKTPAALIFGVTRDVSPAWTVKGTVQYNFWDVFNHLSINMPQAFATNATFDTKWKNAWFGSVGADYRATDAWTLRGGVGFDETPTTHLRDPRIPDSDRVYINLGASYVLNKHFSVDGAYSFIHFQDQSVNVTQASGTNAVTTVPLEVNTVSAKFHGTANVVGLALRYNFC